MQSDQVQTKKFIGNIIISAIIFIIVAALAYFYFQIFVLGGTSVMNSEGTDEQTAADTIRREEMIAPPIVEINLDENRKTDIQQDLREKPVAPKVDNEQESLRSQLTN